MEIQIQTAYKYQVAGHPLSIHSSTILDHSTGETVKGIAKNYSLKEETFYKVAIKSFPNFIGKIIPRYYGVFQHPNPSKKYILIEDLLSEYTNPSIIDIKVGSRTYDDEASKEKRENSIHKCLSTTSSSLFFRISGMKVFN